MKKLVILIFVVLAAAFLIIQCEKEKPAIMITVADGILEQLEKTRPEEVFVYEALPFDPAATLKQVVVLVDMRDSAADTKELMQIKQGDRYLEVRKVSNAVFYGNMTRLWNEKPSPERTEFDIPDNDSTTAIVKNWLYNAGFPDNYIKQLDISIVDELFEITLPENPDKVIKISTGKNVKITRSIGDLKIYGFGSKIKLFIGEGGIINGFSAVWRQYIPSSRALGHKAMEGDARGSRAKPIGARTAFENFKKNPLDHVPLAMVNKIDINQAEFGYFSHAAAQAQRYLQPVYVFSGYAYADLPGGVESKVPFKQYVPALSEPFESIWSEGRVIKPELRKIDQVPPEDKDEDEKVE